MKKSNDVLREEVVEAIKWEPLLSSNEIDVSVQDGIVTLGGTVDNYTQKREAEQAVKNIAGVKAIVDDMKVDLFFSAIKSDTDIASSVIKALRENWAVPDHRIQVTVENGWVTLEGILHWNFQRRAADNAIRYLPGVRGVIDQIKIEAEIKNELGKEIVEKALSRSWILDVNNIKVRVEGKTIYLSGIVDSLFQKEEAERIAWNTPGVWYVDNELVVDN
ncbi:ornithine aminotransferase [Flavobacterium aquidurense]|uniref:BON domain-containing protein n=1 Tax=Flavobacterium aquidurense TaxID=362413 RepID=UPI00091911AF|nr:BON domain-containing protein [Flavobacterium aquidurense]OXA68252.1 ornithine aminotransferase [Flavobacterium aquidurense]SHH83535.1 Osmotically-inducible protein OsmY, contains BON domain [Flavobacterium frigidimaris]